VAGGKAGFVLGNSSARGSSQSHNDHLKEHRDRHILAVTTSNNIWAALGLPR
jgi:hypothetical protein